jgi:hypothetical protein
MGGRIFTALSMVRHPENPSNNVIAVTQRAIDGRDSDIALPIESGAVLFPRRRVQRALALIARMRGNNG